MRNNKNGKILNILLGVIAIFIIILVIAWVVNRGGNKNIETKEAFTNNLNEMQDTAKEYFANDLPSNVGDSSLLSLKEMYELDLIDKLVYGKDKCDEDASYISITKINNSEYKIKSNLVCGDKKDSVTEKIESDIIVKDVDGKTIVDENNDDNTIIENKKGSKKGNSTVKSTTGCVDIHCTITEIPTTCDYNYEYEFVRRSVSCPYGYVMENGSCVKKTVETIDATPTYDKDYEVHEPAKENVGGTYKVYADPIVTPGTTTYSCSEGTLSGDKCIITKDRTTSTGCPSGYTKDGNYCYKYADITTTTTYTCPSGYTKSGSGESTTCTKTTTPTAGTTTYTCPSGYTKSGSGSSTTCTKTTTPTAGTTTYTCPSGYTKSGSGSSTTCTKTTTPTPGTTTYTCPSGYTKSGSGSSTTCTKTTNATAKTTCPTGYTLSNGKCYKTTTPNKVYTSWGNPVSTYQTNTAETTYVHDLEKKVLVGSTSKKVAGKTITTYTYALYKRSYSYSCSTGTLSGSLCYIYATANTTYSCSAGTLSGSKCIQTATPTKSTTASTCPSPYTKSGDKCIATVAPTKNTSASTCPSGYTKSGDKCIATVAPTKNTSASTCPSGYTKSGDKCIATATPTKNTTTSCPSGYTKDGSKCYKKEAVSISYSCPTGFVLNGTVCKKTVNATKNTTADKYSCPSGYTKTGSGKDTKCYQTRQNDSTYYCEKADAKLIGKTCYYTVEGKQNGYTCPSGYNLNGTKCNKTVIDYANPSWGKEEIVYSKNEYLEGYQRTGVIKLKMVCHAIEEIHYK